MILRENDVLLNITKDDKLHENLTISDTEKLLKPYRDSTEVDISKKSTIDVPGVTMYFANDENKNIFQCEIYRTIDGSERWIMFMKDDVEGYALYYNPASKEYEMAWYNSTLKDPVDEEEEKKMITCYVPIDY